LRKYFDRRCRNTHSLADYMAQKQDDIGDVCPVFEAIGKCKDGWRCCWLSGHIRKVDEGEEGGLEGWKLVEDSQVRSALKLINWKRAAKAVHEELNRVSPEEQKALRHNKIPLPLSTEFLRILEEQDRAKSTPQTAEHNTDKESELRRDNESLAKEENLDEDKESLHREHRAAFTNTSLRPMEKRRVCSYI
jgi:tRNA-dihydrouridine synthase 3